MRAAPELGRIEKIDLREVWRNEAADFTPWLADDVSKLGEAFGAGTFRRVFGPILDDPWRKVEKEAMPYPRASVQRRGFFRTDIKAA